MTRKMIHLMLKESNAIEGVYDKISMLDARKAWEFINRFDRINTQIIKATHKILMKNQDIERKYKGEWRDVPVWIGEDKKDDPPLIITHKIREWCKHVNEIMDKDDKNHQIPIHCHVNFEEIHPFIDGNGRIGRILMNWQITKMGMPLVVYTESDKRTYYKLFPSFRAKELQKMWDIIQKDISNVDYDNTSSK